MPARPVLSCPLVAAAPAAAPASAAARAIAPTPTPTQGPTPARRLGLMAAAGLVVGLVAGLGCAPAATYPKVEGSVAIDQPRLAPIPELMADAIEAAREEVGTEGGRIAFNLPDGTPVAVWNEVLRRVEGSVPATNDDEAVVHVTQVRLRGNDADVDVIIEPREARPIATPYLLTVTMKQEFLRDWKTTRTRAWRLPVDVPALSWVPATPRGRDAVAVPEPTLPPAEAAPSDAGESGDAVGAADETDGTATDSTVERGAAAGDRGVAPPAAPSAASPAALSGVSG